MNQHYTSHTGRNVPLTNAERQRRFRERRRLRENPPPDDRTLDMFGEPSVTVASGQFVMPAVTPVQVEPVTPAVTPELRVDPSMLLPCPFCGGRAFFEDHGNGMGCAFCFSCKCRTRPTSEPLRAVANWNRRV